MKFQYAIIGLIFSLALPLTSHAGYLCSGDTGSAQLLDSNGSAVEQWTWTPGHLNAIATCQCYVEQYTQDDLRCDGDSGQASVVNSSGTAIQSYAYRPGLYNAMEQCRLSLGKSGYNPCTIL